MRSQLLKSILPGSAAGAAALKLFLLLLSLLLLLLLYIHISLIHRHYHVQLIMPYPFSSLQSGSTAVARPPLLQHVTGVSIHLNVVRVDLARWLAKMLLTWGEIPKKTGGLKRASST